MILEFGTKPVEITEILKDVKDYSSSRIGDYIKIIIPDKQKTIIQKLKEKGFKERVGPN